jgi:hypothetical protein
LARHSKQRKYPTFGTVSQLHCPSNYWRENVGFKAILLFTVAISASASEPAVGRWEGAVQIPGRDLR